MNKQPGGAKTAGIVIAAALLAIGVLFLVFFLAIRGGNRDTITLPAQAPAVQQEQQSASDDLFISVDRDNVQQILAAMKLPEAYHQTIEVSWSWENGSGAKTVELWCSGARRYAEIREADAAKYLLTNGTDAWVWYERDAEALSVQLDDMLTFDDLLGIPTYESISRLEVGEIQEAGFVTLEDMDDTNCLYISVTEGESGYQDRFWVNTGTQLLCKADSLHRGTQVYRLQQSALEILTVEDATFDGRFRLPNGEEITEE